MTHTHTLDSLPFMGLKGLNVFDRNLRIMQIESLNLKPSGPLNTTLE